MCLTSIECTRFDQVRPSDRTPPPLAHGEGAQRHRPEATRTRAALPGPGGRLRGPGGAYSRAHVINAAGWQTERRIAQARRKPRQKEFTGSSAKTLDGRAAHWSTNRWGLWRCLGWPGVAGRARLGAHPPFLTSAYGDASARVPARTTP